MSSSRDAWVWREVVWPRPFDIAVGVDLLDRLASDRNPGVIGWEARACKGRVRYLVGTHASDIDELVSSLRGLVPRLTVTKAFARRDVLRAGRVTVSHPALALNTERTSAVVRSTLAALVSVHHKDEAVIQVLLGARSTPGLGSRTETDPRATWVDVLRGSVPQATTEARRRMHVKRGMHGFACTIRIGVASGEDGTARSLIRHIVGGLRVADAAGVHIGMTPEAPDALNQVKRPWRWPLHLSAPERACLMAWPLGEEDLPGQPGKHPRVLTLGRPLKTRGRDFGVTAGHDARTLGISAEDSLHHTVLLGPTGAGKSTAMLSLIEADMKAGRGVLVIDPKVDLTNDVLARVPEGRKKDVVVIDPMSSSPVGLNPLAAASRNPEQVTDGIVAVFRELFADSWGPRTQDVLTSAVLTLARHPGSTLVQLPALLSDAGLRRHLTKGLRDPVGLESFWASYEAMSVPQRAQVIAPVMNKLRQFLLRPSLRNILGQADPGFDLGDLLTKRKIVLVSLNKGIVGSEGARLLGALVVSQLWPLILARASVAHRPIVSVYIDEVQDYLALPTDLADALAQARSLGVGFTLAHQYRNQLPPALRSGIDANARNKIVFGLNSGDATDMAKMAPDLEMQDFMLLPRFGVYASLLSDGHATGWVSGVTTAPGAVTSDPVELRALSARLYGREAKTIAKEIEASIGVDDADTGPDDVIGRRPRRQP
jgi:hypothetical protein